jgi:hypothetical protein
MRRQAAYSSSFFLGRLNLLLLLRGPLFGADRRHGRRGGQSFKGLRAIQIFRGQNRQSIGVHPIGSGPSQSEATFRLLAQTLCLCHLGAPTLRQVTQLSLGPDVSADHMVEHGTDPPAA